MSSLLFSVSVSLALHSAAFAQERRKVIFESIALSRFVFYFGKGGKQSAKSCSYTKMRGNRRSEREREFYEKTFRLQAKL